MPLPPLVRTIGGGGESEGAVADLVVPGRRRHDFVDEAPVDGALAAGAFLGGAEDVGAVAAHLALVGEAGEPAGAGQHREQRQFRQTDATDERRSSRPA